MSDRTSRGSNATAESPPSIARGTVAPAPIDLSEHPHVRGYDWRFWKYALIATAVTLAAVSGTMLYALLGPDPPLKVITEFDGVPLPFRGDGTADFERYLRDRGREGVTPENNAAVPLLQALLPAYDVRDPKKLSQVCEALGIDAPVPLPPSIASESFEAAKEQATLLLRRRGPAPREATTTEAIDLLKAVQDRPWSAEQYPALAARVRGGASLYAMLAEAADRPKFWLPPVQLVDDKEDLIVGSGVEHLNLLRVAARTLNLAAMLEIGSGDYDAAWSLIRTQTRLAALASRQPDSLTALTAHASFGIGVGTVQRLLGRPDVPPAILQAIGEELDDTELDFEFIDKSVWTQRLILRDLLSSGHAAEAVSHFVPYGEAYRGTVLRKVAFVAKTRLDWNRILELAEFQLTEVSAVDDAPTRRERIRDAEAFVKSLDVPTATWPSLLTSRSSREELLARICTEETARLCLMGVNIEDQWQTDFELLRVAVALRTHAAERGEYPQSLEGLRPNYLGDVPADPLGARPFGYRTKPDGGCWLWSVGGADERALASDAALEAARTPGDRARRFWVIALPAPGVAGGE